MIKEKEEILAEGIWSNSEKCWKINYSAILSALICKAGYWCKNYSSDLFVQWNYTIENKMNNRNLQTETVVFAFRENGVDGPEVSDYRLNINDLYKEVVYLNIIVSRNRIKMILHN